MTLEKIGWIVGVNLGSMHEDEKTWGAKLKSPLRVTRIVQARSICYLVMFQTCGMSYGEIATAFNRKHLSIIQRSLSWARDWKERNPEMWDRIEESVKLSIEAEQKKHEADSGIIRAS